MAMDKTLKGIGITGTTKGPMMAGGFAGDVAARPGAEKPPKPGKAAKLSMDGDKAPRKGVAKGAKSSSADKKGADGPTPGAKKPHAVERAAPNDGTWPKSGGMK
jgi:hypothetical protein